MLPLTKDFLDMHDLVTKFLVGPPVLQHQLVWFEWPSAFQCHFEEGLIWSFGPQGQVPNLRGFPSYVPWSGPASDFFLFAIQLPMSILKAPYLLRIPLQSHQAEYRQVGPRTFEIWRAASTTSVPSFCAERATSGREAWLRLNHFGSI